MLTQMPTGKITKLKKQGPEGVAAPTLGKAGPLFNASKLINAQYDEAEGRLGNMQQESARSALENAQRGAAINNTTGAGFNTKIQQDAVNESAKPYLDTRAGLASDRAGALVGAGQAQDTMKEGQRQFDFSAGLQKYAATNEMDLNKFSTFVNSSTALKQAGFDNPEAWANIFKAGILPDAFKKYGINTPDMTAYNAQKAAEKATATPYRNPNQRAY